MKTLLLFVLMFVFVFCFVGCGSEASNIGIIGGADGPTAIFVSSNINWLYICGLIGVIAAVLVAFVIYRKKKNK